MSIPHGYIANGVTVSVANNTVNVVSPWSGLTAFSVAAPDPSDVPAIVGTARQALTATRATSRSERARVLNDVADRVQAAAEDFAQLVMQETGKTLKDCRAEVVRTVSTLRFSANVALELVGESLALDAVAGVDGRLALTVPHPVGVVAAIPAFNYPLLLAAHKVGPAIAAGCAFVLKPANRTPLSAVRFGEEVLRAGWPAAAVSVLPGYAEIGHAITTDPGIDLITFTGSTIVGHAISRQAGPIKILLELGSNAPTIVLEDADLGMLIDRSVVGGFTANGQSCISVQRILVHRTRYHDVVDALAERVRALHAGDPADPQVDVGPVIDDSAADRIMALIEDARAHGAQILVGGTRSGRVIEPTLIAGLTPEMRLQREEVFGPVVIVGVFDVLDEAIEIANATEYGLQAGVFTNSIDQALELADRLDFGSVHINEISTFRPDHMPYGGVKGSGIGKEGPRYVAEEMTDWRVVSMRAPGRKHHG